MKTQFLIRLVPFFMAAAAASGTPLVKDGETIAFLGDSITQQGHDNAVGYVNLVMKGLEVAGVKDLKLVKAGVG